MPAKISAAGTAIMSDPQRPSDLGQRRALLRTILRSLFGSPSHLFGGATCAQNCRQWVLGQRQDEGTTQSVIRAGIVPTLEHAAELNFPRCVEDER